MHATKSTKNRNNHGSFRKQEELEIIMGFQKKCGTWCHKAVAITRLQNFGSDHQLQAKCTSTRRCILFGINSEGSNPQPSRI